MSSPDTWRFPAAFWIANTIELCERAAHYGSFIFLTVLLTSVVGYSDIEAGWISALFAGGLYLFPMFTGAAADRVGYRASLLAAFTLLTIGYVGLGLFPRRGLCLLWLFSLCIGGALVKPVITGTVARLSDAAHRARAFSLFYMIVNIGSFSGKSIAKPVRAAYELGAIPLFSGAATAIALCLCAAFYFPDRARKGSAPTPAKTLSAVVADLRRVLSNGRFLALLLITAGYWIIQGQLYASMPKYVLRLLGKDASPEWYANINPLIVVLGVVPITHLCRRLPAPVSIGVCLFLAPVSALLLGVLPGLLSPWTVSLPFMAARTLPPLTQAMCLGIAVQGLAECFLTPRYMEFASHQAPAGQEGLYLGYAQLNTFFAWLTGFVLSGYLLDAYCPDPARLPAAERAAHALWQRGLGPTPAAYAHAGDLWTTFAAIGACAFLLLLGFLWLTRRRLKPAPAP